MDRQATAFGRQMALEGGDRPGRYRVELDARWNCPVVTHGGTATAVAVAAMEQLLATPTQALRTVTALFAAPVGPGPAVVDVTILRRGRSATQLSATICNEGAAAGLSALAVFGAPRPGYAFTDRRPPPAPGPGASRSWRAPRPDGAAPAGRNVFWDSVEGRSALPADEAPGRPRTSLNASWFRYDEPPLTADGALDPLAAIALCDTMPSAVWQPMDPDQRRGVVVNTDLTVHLVGTARSPWVLGVNRAHRVGEGYASVELELWDEAEDLVAFATSMMVLNVPREGPPQR